jgi:hypothetical protein
MSICVNDHSGVAWLQVFNEIGNQILGKTAEELNQMKETVCSSVIIQVHVLGQ